MHLIHPSWGSSTFGSTVALVTALGKVKRLVIEPGLKAAIGMDPKDRLVAAFGCEPTDDVVFISSAGQLLRSAVDTVPVQGAGAQEWPACGSRTVPT